MDVASLAEMQVIHIPQKTKETAAFLAIIVKHIWFQVGVFDADFLDFFLMRVKLTCLVLSRGFDADFSISFLMRVKHTCLVLSWGFDANFLDFFSHQS